MKNFTIRIAFLAFVFLGGYAYHANEIHAQAATAAPWQVAVAGAHSLCTAVASTTTYCFAQDGLWVSINGATFTQVGGVTGNVVTSLNGKTGDLKLSASTVATTTATTTVTAQ